MLGEANTQGLILGYTSFTLKYSGVTRGQVVKLKMIDQIIPIFEIRPRSIATARSCDMEKRIQVQNHWRAVLNQTTSRCSPSRNPLEVLSRPCTPSNMAPNAEQGQRSLLSYLHTWYYLMPPFTNSMRSAASMLQLIPYLPPNPVPPASPLVWNHAHQCPSSTLRSR